MTYEKGGIESCSMVCEFLLLMSDEIRGIIYQSSVIQPLMRQYDIIKDQKDVEGEKITKKTLKLRSIKLKVGEEDDFMSHFIKNYIFE